MIKLLTTSRRFHRLADDLDVNAGRLLEGVSLEQLRDETFAYVKHVAEGVRTKGERAKHSQVIPAGIAHSQMQIWRNWDIPADPAQFPVIPAGDGYALYATPNRRPFRFTAIRHSTPAGTVVASSTAGMVVFPTSLCSSQIAVLLSRELQSSIPAGGNTRFITALTHTEGCAAGYGVSASEGIWTYNRVSLGHLLHPCVSSCFLLEHGCEKTLLSYFAQLLRQHGLPGLAGFGHASVQGDGGIGAAIARGRRWALRSVGEGEEVSRGGDGLVLAMMSDRSRCRERPAGVMAAVAAWLVAYGCVVVVPESDLLLASPAFRAMLGREAEEPLPATLMAGETAIGRRAGLQVMRGTGPRDYLETVTALAATGAEGILVLSETPVVLSGHPFVPTIRVGVERGESDVFDVVTSDGEEALMDVLMDVLSRRRQTKTAERGLVDFQMPRTSLGFSL